MTKRPFFILLFAGLLPGNALAVPTGPWAMVSPGLITVDLIPTRPGTLGYQWGVGGGVLLDDLPFLLSVGGELEHGMNFQGAGFTFHRVRIGPVARAGVELGDSAFLYGLVGVGITVFVQNGVGTRAVTPAGLDVALGGGVEARLTDNLGLGGELQLDVESAFITGWTMLPLQAKATLIWHFDG